MNSNYKVFEWVSRNSALFLGCLGTVALYLLVRLLPEENQYFNFGDFAVYYSSSKWAIGQGFLYKDVPSEYLLLPNLLFGAARFVSELLHPFSSSFRSFTWVWLSVTWWLYIWATFQIITKTEKGSVWVWLGPATIFSALLRFDLFPAIATFLALLSLKNQKYMAGAFWIGIGIALKGYLLFTLPAFVVFALYQKGLKETVRLVIVCLLPMIVTNALVLAYAGWGGMLSPYAFHSVRTNNGESTYDALLFLTSPLSFYRGKVVDLPYIVKFLPIITSLLAAALRPKDFNGLIDALLISVLGFMSFSVFYSPQFILWIAPIACFSSSAKIKLVVAAFSWVTFIYHPLFNAIRFKLFSSSQVWDIFFGLIILTVTSMRFLMMYFSFRRLRKAAST